MADDSLNPDPNATATDDPAMADAPTLDEVSAAIAVVAEPVPPPAPAPPDPVAHADVPLDLMTQILVDYDCSGRFILETVELGAAHQRQMERNGSSLEHVGTEGFPTALCQMCRSTHGRWMFRAMPA